MQLEIMTSDALQMYTLLKKRELTKEEQVIFADAYALAMHLAMHLASRDHSETLYVLAKEAEKKMIDEMGVPT
jgi:hypothetical protein